MTPSERLQRLDDSAERASRRLFAAVFGDRIGAGVFIAAILFFALYWRVELLSTDNYMHMNTLLSVSDGGFAIDRFVYGPADGDTPGVHYLDGQVYGDNYGMIISSLPALYALRLLSVVTDLHVALAGLWSLGVLGLTAVVRSEVESAGRREGVTLCGATVALGAFLVNVAVATPLSTYWLPLVALQSTSMLAAGFLAVALYRVAGDRYGPRVGIAAGVGTFLATPVGFWAVVPKRHSVTALFTVVTLYAFYRSRAAPSDRSETRFRALAYGVVGLCTWVHAAEALILFVALVPVDLATARTNRPRQLALVGVAFVVSLLPFLVTNYAITGNPTQPLRLVTDYGSQPLAVDGGTGGSAAVGGATDGQSAGASAASSSSSGTPDATSRSASSSARQSPSPPPAPTESDTSILSGLAGLAGIVSGVVASAGDAFVTAVDGVDYFQSRLASSMRVVTDVDRVSEVFLRSGYRPLRTGQDRAVNLSVLESMPLLGAVGALPAVAVRVARNRLFTRPDGGSPSVRSFQSIRALSAARATDLFVLLYAATLVVFYLSSLPLHHMLTVRYLHPLYPVGVYALVRTPAVRRVLDDHWTTMWRSYLGAVVAVTALYLGALALLDTVQGEAIQLYGLGAFLLGLLVVVWAVGTELLGDDSRALHVGSVVLGVAAALMSVYLLVSGLVLFSVEGTFALPISRAVSDALVAVNPFR